MVDTDDVSGLNDILFKSSGGVPFGVYVYCFCYLWYVEMCQFPYLITPCFGGV